MPARSKRRKLAEDDSNEQEANNNTQEANTTQNTSSNQPEDIEFETIPIEHRDQRSDHYEMPPVLPSANPLFESAHLLLSHFLNQQALTHIAVFAQRMMEHLLNPTEILGDPALEAAVEEGARLLDLARYFGKFSVIWLFMKHEITNFIPY